ncbi:MAG: GNAT family N-acetyltransferase [Flavobacteriaceae bacterium]|nr:GNAT family N-acetyltransferase [Flavobacteriaceae bacterium]
MQSPYPIFETVRLYLRATKTTDTKFLLDLMNSPLFLKHVGDRNLKSPKDAEKYIQLHIESQWKLFGYGSYTLILKKNMQPIGVCGLYQRETIEGIDIGYAILPLYHRNGYAFEAANKLLKEAFNTFRFKKVYAIVHPSNKASIQLLKKLQMQFLDHIKLEPNTNYLLRYVIMA